MGKAGKITERVWQRIKGAASSVLAAVAAPKRGAHSSDATAEGKTAGQSAGFKRGAHSAPASRAAADTPAPTPAPRTRAARLMRSRSSRGAHTASSRRPRAIAARGAHSAPRAPRPSVPVSLKTAPAAARGFSMTEVLASVAIILILGSLVVMNVVALQANLRQKELDSKAEIIYAAAQEQMTRLMAGGREYVLTPDQVLNSPTGGTPSAGNTGDLSRPQFVEELPADVEQSSLDAESTLCYISSVDKSENSPAAVLLGDNVLDDELYANDWVIEYDYKTLTVHAVFYSEDRYNESGFSLPQSYRDLYAGAYRHALRSFSNRLECRGLIGNNHVGYHGGGTGGSYSSFRLTPSIDVKNGDKLTATVTCSKPLSVTQELVFTVTLTDEFGNKRKSIYTMDPAYTSDKYGVYCYQAGLSEAKGTNATQALLDTGSLEKLGLLDYTLTLNFDDLSSPKTRFAYVYGGQGPPSTSLTKPAGNDDLVIGSNVKISVEVSCPDNALVSTGYAGSTITNPCEFNSLFDDRTDTSNRERVVAGISCGRHLQNLDASSYLNYSPDTLKVTAAEQHADVDFTIDSDEEGNPIGWAGYYSAKDFFNPQPEGSTVKTANFKPISNDVLGSYNGWPSDAKSPYRIAGLSTASSTSAPYAGLFCTISSAIDLKNIALVDARIDASEGGSAGALAGAVSAGGNKVTVDNCQVFLNRPKGNGSDTKPAAWISGKNAGGLFGAVSTGTGSVSITNSSASSVVEGVGAGGRAGGLVGSVVDSSTVKIDSSYTDCYLYGLGEKGSEGFAAGLACGNLTSVSSSYTAGFIAAKEGAGLVYGKPGTVTSTYTVCAKIVGASDGDATYYATSSEQPAAGSGKIYFLKSGGTLPSAEYGVEFEGSDSATEIASKAIALKDNLGSESFTLDHKDLSTPYNLMNQGLVSYPWPTIKHDVASVGSCPLVHYGDWTSGFQSGTLVYYEAYKNKGGGYSYGFSGAGVPSTLKDTDNVVGDGYAMVFGKDETIPSSITVNISDPEDSSGAVLITQDIDAGSTNYVTGDYRLFPLRSLISSDSSPGAASISNTSRVNSTSFFLAAQILFKDSASGAPVVVGSSRYFYNPHFANSVREAAEGAKPTSPADSGEPIAIRTSRQLYNLSKYYQQYRTCTKGCVFEQHRNMRYSTYEWHTFYKAELDSEGNVDEEASRIKEQAPIGAGSAKSGESFLGTYDGGHYWIEDVGFVGDDDKNYLGMFGYVGADSVLRDIVLCTDYDSSPSATNYCVRRMRAAQARTTVYMGVLAGYNAGTIKNCAVAGYFLDGADGTVHALANSTIYAGGVVGGNIGTVTHCSADCPKLRLSQLSATVTAGGFVGANELSSSKEGIIRHCYALGSIELADSQGGTVVIGGFAGGNRGTITSSYSAVPIIASGDNKGTFGFAPTGGYVSKCSYLNGGTYSYVKNMYAFYFDPNGKTSAGLPVSYSELMVAAGSRDAVEASRSYVFSETVSAEKRYPFAGKVTDANKNYVHYGNWLDDAVLGSLGVFYWEHELGGSNDGYHMAHIGTGEAAAAESGANPVPKLVTGSSLCNSHADDGVITEYGYGFYVQKGQEGQVEVEWGGIASSMQDSNIKKVIASSKYNTAASTSLRSELSSTGAQYSLVAFTTSTLDGSDDFIRMSAGAGTPNGTLSFTYENTNGTDVAYRFEMSPFFANAMSLKSYSYGGSAESLDSLYGKAADGAWTNYLMEPGTNFASGETIDPALKSLDPARKDKNYYEVRSVQQLQYINWNAETKSVKTLVPDSAEIYKAYPYLQYATDPNGTRQWRKDAEADRPARYWMQTHDLSGSGQWDDPASAAAAMLGEAPAGSTSAFSPIAGGETSCPIGDGYDSWVYAWFGGHYDGQSYTIRNVHVKSDAFHVGLFGVTAGAEVKNVIMRGSNVNDSVVERVTEGGRQLPGAYVLGGLIGLAYGYSDLFFGNAAAQEAEKYAGAISNCAISDYVVRDASTNRQTHGEACVGGLIGVAKIDLKQCSAVTSIKIECVPVIFGMPGNYIRVGGLVGGLRRSCTDSYSGGEIQVSGDVLKQTCDGSDPGRILTESMIDNKSANKYRSTHIYLAGIAGCSFSTAVKNFGDVVDENMTIKNCYTYMTFPKMEGTIRAISMIASVADRYETGFRSPIIENCYYLDRSAKFAMDLPKYHFNNLSNVLLEDLLASKPSEDSMLTYKDLMIKGNVGYLKKYYENSWSNKKYTKLEVNPLTYEQMSRLASNDKLEFANTLDNGRGIWDAVTKVDAKEGAIDGKYSYPSNEALADKNYPFPTVVTQNDLTYGSVSNPVNVHVHYGNWPSSGSSWKRGRDAIDIFSDMGGDGIARKTFYLDVDTSKSSELGSISAEVLKGKFSVGDSQQYAVIESASYIAATRQVAVVVRAKNVGTTVVTFTNRDDASSFTLEVTANWCLYAEPAGGAAYNAQAGRLKVGMETPQSVTLHAGTLDGTREFTMSPNLKWGSPAASNKSIVFPNIIPRDEESNTLPGLTATRLKRGVVTVNVPAVYNYGGVELEQLLTVTVVERGVVGISTGEKDTDGFIYKEVKIDDGGAAVGCEYPEDEEPRYALNSKHNFYLYVSVDENLLMDLGDIKKIEVDGKEIRNGVYDPGEDYYVRIDKKEDGAGLFSYLGGIVSYNKTAPSGDVPLTITVENSGKQYVLSTALPADSVPQTKTVTYSFASGGNPFAIEKKREVILPVGGKFTFTDPTQDPAFGFAGINQYVFKNWAYEDGSYNAGRTVTVADVPSGRIDFTASWVKRYGVTLDWGDGGDKPRFMVFNGDTQFGSSDRAAYDAKRATMEGDVESKGFELEGWFDGTGPDAEMVLDPDGAVVADSSVNGVTDKGAYAFDEASSMGCTLHAKWVKRITYYVQGDVQGDLVRDAEGAVKAGENYLIANTKQGETSPASSNGQMLTQPDPTTAVDAISEVSKASAGKHLSSTQVKVYQNAEMFEGRPYILGEDVKADSVWQTVVWPLELNLVTNQENFAGFKNLQYGHYLADNDCKLKYGQNYYILTTIEDTSALKGWADGVQDVYNKEPLKRLFYKIESSTSKLRNNAGKPLGFAQYSYGSVNDQFTVWVDNGNFSNTYLYHEKIVELPTFDYNAILSGSLVASSGSASGGSEGGTEGGSTQTASLFSTLFNKPDDEQSESGQ